MRNHQLRTIRRILRITKASLIIILHILTIIAKLKAL